MLQKQMLQGAGVSTAIQDNVLAGEVTGLGAAHEGAELAEFLGRAKTAGGILQPPLLSDGLNALAAYLGRSREGRAQPVRFERSRQQVVDRDIVTGDLPRDAGDEAREAGPRAVRKAKG